MAKKKKKPRKKNNSGQSKSVSFAQPVTAPKTIVSQDFDRRSDENVLRNVESLIEEHGIEALEKGGKLSNPEKLNELLSKMEKMPKKLSAFEDAQDLMDQAFESSRKSDRIWFARKARAISSDCVDAYVLLAEEDSATPQQAIELYRQGVEAGRRTLGEETFTQDAGSFWGLIETRPFMRALFGLGKAEYYAGELQQAIDHYTEILHLTESDNLGERYSLVHWLIQARSFDTAKSLVEKFHDDPSASWKYANALLSFAQFGDTEKSLALLEQAIRSNQHLPNYLLGIKTLPEQLPFLYSLGDENEAVNYMMVGSISWCETEGAKDWLRDFYLTEEEISLISKRMMALDIVEELPIDDLAILNERICDRLKELNDQEIREAMAKIRLGDKVSFLDDDGVRLRGVVKKLNKKTVEVLAENMTVWKIAARLIEKTPVLGPDDILVANENAQKSILVNQKLSRAF